MKQAFRFYSRYLLQYSAIYIGFAALVTLTTRISGSMDNLFGSYAQMYLIFMLMFPPIYALSSGIYLDAALSMGAQRRSCFWAAELTFALSTAMMPLTHVPMTLLLEGLPSDRWNLHPLSPCAYLILYLIAMVLTQTALLSSHTSGAKAPVIIVVFCMLLGGGAGGALSLVFLNPEALGKINIGIDLLPLALTTPFWGIFAAVCTALILVLGFFARRMYGKAVVRL